MGAQSGSGAARSLTTDQPVTARLFLALLSTCVVALPAMADLEITLPDPNGKPAPKKAKAVPAKKTIKPLPKNPPDRVNLPLAGSAPLRQIGIARRGSAVPVLPSVGEAPLTGTPAEAQPGGQMPVNARLGRTLSPAVNIFRMPDAQSQWLGTLKQGQQVAVVSQWQGWWAIVMGDGSQAYVPQSHVELLPYQVRTVTSATPALPPAPAPSTSAMQNPLRTASYTGPAKALIDEAYRYMGTPYVYGGNSERGIDCSGLVKNCFSSLGIQLPRRASEQARIGLEVPLDQLQPGDRLYFSVGKENDHTGIYLGDGYFIHAARSRGKVSVDRLSIPLYTNHLTAARR